MHIRDHPSDRGGKLRAMPVPSHKQVLGWALQRMKEPEVVKC